MIEEEKLTIKERVQEWIFKFQNLEPKQRNTIILIIVSGFVVVFGTFAIILNAVLQIEKRNEEQKMKNFYGDVDSIIEEFELNLEEFSFENLDDESKDIKSNFENYGEELEKVDRLINSFELPTSSPISE